MFPPPTCGVSGVHTTLNGSRALRFCVLKVDFFVYFFFLVRMPFRDMCVNTYEGRVLVYLQEWEVSTLCQIHADMLGQGFYWLTVAACDAAALPGKLRF